MRPLDTTPEAWTVVTDGIRRMSPAERINRAVALTILSHSVALAKIRRSHPDEDERTHRLRLAARFLDATTMRAAFGWCDD